MRRWLVRICAVLLLGAIVNIAVAWGCATWDAGKMSSATVWSEFSREEVGLLIIHGSNKSQGNGFPRDVAQVLFRQYAPEVAVADRISGSTEFRWTMDSTLALVPQRFSPWAQPAPLSVTGVREAKIGWPLRSMVSAVQFRLFAPEIGEQWVVPLHSIVVPASHSEMDIGRGRLLPTRPIWPGFAINTVVYAFVLYGLIAVPAMLRRKRRARRGLCWKCAYDLRNRAADSSVCPECGAAVA